MNSRKNENFAHFLAMPIEDQVELLLGRKLLRYQVVLLRDFDSMKCSNPHLRSIDLWESMYKAAVLKCGNIV